MLRSLGFALLLCFNLFAQNALAGPSIDDFLSACPTAAQVTTLNARFGISFEGDPSLGQLACTSASGSANLSPVQKRVYATLLALEKVRFDSPLPFSSATSLYDWLASDSGVSGIRFRGDLSFSYCCEPSQVINIALDSKSEYLHGDTWYDATRDVGLIDEAAILVHFARHVRAGDHDCVVADKTVEQLGAWGSAYFALMWLANHVDHDLVRPKASNLPFDLYRDIARRRAEELRSTYICEDTRRIETVPVVEYFNRGSKHYFLTADQGEIAMLDSGLAGREWARSGFSFQAFKSAETAPSTALPVCRFRGNPGTGPNSHFFGLSTEECAIAHADSGWTFEGTPFYMVKPTWSICPDYGAGKKTVRVWRAYNNGFGQNDANFRLTTNADSYFGMQRHNWAMQGVAMCAAE